jgi:hypothetical protein
MRLLTVALLFFFTTGAHAMVFKKLPKTIEVGDSTYAVYYVKRLDRGRLLGACYSESKRMQISMEMGRSEAESTVIHELLHAIADEYKIKKLNEKMVQQLEEAIFDVFDQNGWVIVQKP